jgi:hypothetical protein
MLIGSGYYLYFANAMCVSSEAAYVMRVVLSMGEEEQPSPSNRLHAALL